MKIWTALLLAGSALTAGCSRAIPEPGPPPAGRPLAYQLFADRAGQVLAAWVPGGLGTRWRTGLVLMSGPGLTLRADGLPDIPAGAAYPRWRYRLKAGLPARSPRQGTVTFIDGFATLQVPLVSAAAAYLAVRGSPPPPGCIAGPCAVFTITGAVLGTVPVYTSRGEALVPAWRFTVAGLGPILRIAVAPGAVAALPRPLAPDRDDRYAQPIYARRDRADPRRIDVGWRLRACDVRLRPAVIESSRAVVVAGLVSVRRRGACAGAGPPYQTAIILRAPLGRRMLLEAGSGLPLIVDGPQPDCLPLPDKPRQASTCSF